MLLCTHESLTELLTTASERQDGRDEQDDPLDQGLDRLGAALDIYLEFGDETSVSRVLRRLSELRATQPAG